MVQFFTIPFPHTSAICAASVKFLPIAYWIHCSADVARTFKSLI